MPRANYYPVSLTTSVRNTLLENRQRVRLKASAEVRLKNPVFFLPSLPEVIRTDIFTPKSEPTITFFDPMPKPAREKDFGQRLGAQLEWAVYLSNFFGKM